MKMKTASLMLLMDVSVSEELSALEQTHKHTRSYIFERPVDFIWRRPHNILRTKLSPFHTLSKRIQLLGVGARQSPSTGLVCVCVLYWCQCGIQDSFNENPKSYNVIAVWARCKYLEEYSSSLLQSSTCSISNAFTFYLTPSTRFMNSSFNRHRTTQTIGKQSTKHPPIRPHRPPFIDAAACYRIRMFYMFVNRFVVPFVLLYALERASRWASSLAFTLFRRNSID